MPEAGTTPDDAYSLPARAWHHTYAEASWGHIPELCGEAGKHRGACKLELSRPGGMVDRYHELAVANQKRAHLTRDLWTDDPLPTAGHTTEDERVLQATLPQQPINSGTDRHCRGRFRL